MGNIVQQKKPECNRFLLRKQNGIYLTVTNYYVILSERQRVEGSVP